MINENDDSKYDDDEYMSALATEDISGWFSYFSYNIERGEDDKRFVYERQWDDVEAASLRRLLKPELQINKVYDIVRKLMGQQRALDPQIQVMSSDYNSPDDDKALLQLQKDINLRQDLIRTITYESDAKIAFSNAFEDAIVVGYGAFYIKCKHESNKSFNQKITIESLSYEKVFFDPKAKTPNKTDGDYCGYFEVLSKKEFVNQYPDIPYPTSFPVTGYNHQFAWGKYENSITVAYYYYKRYFKRTLLLLDDGSTMYEDEYKRRQKNLKKVAENPAALELEPMSPQELYLPGIDKKREVDDYDIYCREMIANRTISTTKWPGKMLPVIYVDGDSYTLDGEQRTQSFVKNSKDPQRFLNYCVVEIADALQKGRRETYMATDAMIAGKERIWKNPAAQQGVLRYNNDKGDKPMVVPPSEVPHSLLQQYQQLGQDIQSTLGIYDANIGAPDSTAFSGVAIANRIRQGAVAAYIYQDNLVRAIANCGKQILELFPIIMDTNRNVVLTGRDGKQRVERINYQREDGTIENSMERGNYNVHIEAGPSYELQKNEAVEMLIKLVQIDPTSFPLIADLIVDNIEIANRPQLVERFKTRVPPDILAKEEGKPPPQPQPNPQLQMEQQQQQQEQAENARKFQLAQRGLNLKAQTNDIKIAEMRSKQYQAELTSQTDRAKIDAEIHNTNTSFNTEMAKAIADRVR